LKSEKEVYRATLRAISRRLKEIKTQIVDLEEEIERIQSELEN